MPRAADACRALATSSLLLLSSALCEAQEGGSGPANDGERSTYDELTQRLETLEEWIERHDLGGADMRTGLQASYGDVRATFQLFGDVGARYANPSEEGHSSFTLGAATFFTNVQIGDRFRVLSETVIEVHSDDESSASQERLWGKYIVDDHLYFKLGTEHSPISRWNQLYHHGRWLETTIARPILAEFEGGRGILPLHRTGLEVGGRVPAGAGGIEYFGTVSNGRGRDPRDKQRASDADDSKAIDVGLAYEAPDLSDLRVGAALTFDEIPSAPGAPDPLRRHSVAEWIATAQVSFRVGGVLLSGEYAAIQHDPRAGGGDFDHDTGYVQLELPGDRWTPYTRFDYRDMSEGDPFYEPLDRDLDEWRQVVGVRNDFSPNTAMKFEVGFGSIDRRDGNDVSGENTVTAALQLSWWF